MIKQWFQRHNLPFHDDLLSLRASPTPPPPPFALRVVDAAVGFHQQHRRMIPVGNGMMSLGDAGQMYGAAAAACGVVWGCGEGWGGLGYKGI